MRGTIQEDILKKWTDAGKNMIYEPVTTDLQNLRKILADRIQITPIDKEVGLTTIRKNFLQETAAKITCHPKLFGKGTPLYVIFGRRTDKGRQYTELFNRGLEKLEKSGQIEQMWKDFRQGKYETE